MNINIKPVGERILIKPVKVEEKTASGIILSVEKNDTANYGEVVAVGKLEKFAEIKVGNKIFYDKSVGTEIKDKDEKFLILNAEDVLAIIK